MRFVLFLALLGSSAIAQTIYKNAGTQLGPAVFVSCQADAGVNCTRTAATGTVNLRCSSASATELGCMTTAAQTLAGNKSFTGKVTANDFGGIDAGPANSTTGFSSGTAGLGTAFASFPAAATATGTMIYDSTNSMWRWSNGFTWTGISPYDTNTLTAYFPGAPATLNVATTKWRLFGAATTVMSEALISSTSYATPNIVGVGAGNAVFTVYNVTTAAATSTTCTVACTATVGTAIGCTNSAAITLPAVLELRLTTNPCGTLPNVNFSFETLSYKAN